MYTNSLADWEITKMNMEIPMMRMPIEHIAADVLTSQIQEHQVAGLLEVWTSIETSCSIQSS